MSGAVFDSELWIAGRHEAINQTRGEAVAAADAIKYLKVLAGGGLEEFATSPADGAPVVDGADLTARRVVAVTLKFGNSLTAFSIIFLKLSTSMAEMFSSTPSTSKPRH